MRDASFIMCHECIEGRSSKGGGWIFPVDVCQGVGYFHLIFAKVQPHGFWSRHFLRAKLSRHCEELVLIVRGGWSFWIVS